MANIELKLLEKTQDLNFTNEQLNQIWENLLHQLVN